MYQKIREEIKQEYYHQNFPNDGQRFVAWYLRNIHLRDMNEALSDITDGAHDKQIDAIVVDDDNNTIYVIQGKFIGESNVDAEPLREVLSSWMQLKDLVRLQENCNDKLKRKLSEVALGIDDDYDVVFELITTGSLTASAQNDLAIFQANIAEADDFPASIHLLDEEELKVRYDMALDRENPSIKHSINLEDGKYIRMDIGGTNVVISAIPLKDCLKIPGIKDGTLFQKNVRQSLGLNNRVNKGIKSTIFHDGKDFFFYHNGVTAICKKMEFENNGSLNLRGLSVVNGCQSLNTILSCSEKIKTLDDSYIMFRFYEIPERDRSDKISVSTNSQSAVKPRDLRSNDKRVLSLKKLYEQKYPRGYFITKRGEDAPGDRDKSYVIDLVDLGKHMISWHSQRPNIAYSETKIFDKYFEQLFKRDYKPENIYALSFWMSEVRKRWIKENPLSLNESLLAMKAYAPYHHLYAISLCFCVSNNMPEGVPNPVITFEKAINSNIVEQIVNMAGSCLNSALEAAANEPQPANRVFSPQNWIKTKSCLAGIRAAIRQYFNMLPSMPGGTQLKQQLSTSLVMDTSDFEARWAAD
ncbi:MAG TPA: AIPR protein [Gammaproteobacteria bacterium]|nr:AIPR protein [Gammaproteobacteria bacterium]